LFSPQNRKAIGIIGIVLALALLFFVTSGNFFAVTYDGEKIIGDDKAEVDSKFLRVSQRIDFCSNEQECINYLKSQGMPINHFQENNIEINCQERVCYLTIK